MRTMPRPAGSKLVNESTHPSPCSSRRWSSMHRLCLVAWAGDRSLLDRVRSHDHKTAPSLSSSASLGGLLLRLSRRRRGGRPARAARNRCWNVLRTVATRTYVDPSPSRHRPGILTVQHHGPSALCRRTTLFSHRIRIQYHVWTQLKLTVSSD